MFPSYKIIDISQPVTSQTACFPGDVPFSKELTVSYESSKLLNLTALTMSPHVGTHADAPSHISGDIGNVATNAGSIALDAYIGPAVVIDLSPMPAGGVTADLIANACQKLRVDLSKVPRLLVKTSSKLNFEQWLGDYPYFSVDAVQYLQQQKVRLVGIDSPSVDHVDSKDLATHHALEKAEIVWLENLNLEHVRAKQYFLFAAPLKLMELEAAPVRAVLLETD